jgi:ADP-ribosyl-[dinitrogen reductase] hydrolase
MLLGLAIGDSLGNSSEGLLPAQRRERWGEVRDYLPSRHNGVARGYPSDDTQLAFWTLDQINQDGGLIPANLARRFCTSGRIFGIGSTVREFLRNHKKLGRDWSEAGPRSAGNGALMRIAPVILPHLGNALGALHGRRGIPERWVEGMTGRTGQNDDGAIFDIIAGSRDWCR